MPDHRPGIRSAQAGILVNAILAGAKLVAGIVGNTYALVADAVESTADIFSSLVVWGGLAIAAQPADEDHPFGHGKAEPLAAAAVSLMLLGAAVGIAVEAVREIRTPHRAPAAWTLVLLIVVMIIKWVMSQRVKRVAEAINSTAVQADAAHHLSDAFTSAAAFIGISIAVLGGPGWEAADDWAALAASLVIAFNGATMLRSALHDLMDRTPGNDVLEPVLRAAASVEGVLAIEKLAARRMGTTHQVTIHVQADPKLTLDQAHELGGRVKYAIMQAVPRVQLVLVHMEPYHGG